MNESVRGIYCLSSYGGYFWLARCSCTVAPPPHHRGQEWGGRGDTCARWAGGGGAFRVAACVVEAGRFWGGAVTTSTQNGFIITFLVAL